MPITFFIPENPGLSENGQPGICFDGGLEVLFFDGSVTLARCMPEEAFVGLCKKRAVVEAYCLRRLSYAVLARCDKPVSFLQAKLVAVFDGR